MGKNERLIELIRELRNQVLLLGEMSLPTNQFRAYKRQIFDLFGRSNGIEAKVEIMFCEKGKGDLK